MWVSSGVWRSRYPWSYNEVLILNHPPVLRGNAGGCHDVPMACQHIPFTHHGILIRFPITVLVTRSFLIAIAQLTVLVSMACYVIALSVLMHRMLLLPLRCSFFSFSYPLFDY